MQEDKFYLKGLSVRWVGCNTRTSAFFDMGGKIPFIQLYGQILNAHTQLQIFNKLNMTVIILQFSCNFPSLQCFPELRFQISMHHIPGRTDGCVALIFFYVSAILDWVAQDRNAVWQNKHLTSASSRPLLCSARKQAVVSLATQTCLSLFLLSDSQVTCTRSLLFCQPLSLSARLLLWSLSCICSLCVSHFLPYLTGSNTCMTA